MRTVAPCRDAIDPGYARMTDVGIVRWVDIDERPMTRLFKHSFSDRPTFPAVLRTAVANSINRPLQPSVALAVADLDYATSEPRQQLVPDPLTWLYDYWINHH
jgi:hypothetical protein